MNKLMKALFCVTFFSIATRGLGFILKIYLSRKMSPQLLGSYQVAMSVFGVLMTFVSSGIPVVSSRNISYYYGKRDQKSIGATVSSGLIITGIICAIISAIILLFPNIIKRLFVSESSFNMLIILLPGLIFSAIYEVLRGALWGQKHFFAISFSEFFEQIVRIIIIVILFETTISNLSQTDKTALSLSLACVFSTILVIIMYFSSGGKLSSPKPELKKLLKTSSTITLVKTISSAFSSVIAVIIPIKLMSYGYSESKALAEFGIIMGMTFPLLLIPSTLIGSLAVTTIPSISELSKDIDHDNSANRNAISEKVNFVIKITVVFSAILIPLFVVLGKNICFFVFANERAGIFLEASAILMLPLGISQISTAVLNALGLEKTSFINYIISAVTLTLSILFLPKYIGTYSIIVGYIIMAVISSTLNIFALKKRNLANLTFFKTIFIMLITSASTISAGFLLSKIISGEILKLILIGSIIMILMLTAIFSLNVANIKVITLKKQPAKN